MTCFGKVYIGKGYYIVKDTFLVFMVVSGKKEENVLIPITLVRSGVGVMSKGDRIVFLTHHKSFHN